MAFVCGGTNRLCIRRIDRQEKREIFYPLLNRLNRFPSILLLGLSIIDSPVAGFLPLRFTFYFTNTFLNPLKGTSSSEARVQLMI
jgi:hypothetical protein